MKMKKNLIAVSVACFLFLILSSALFAPAQAATALESSKPKMPLDVQRLSENTSLISLSTGKMVMENLPDNCFRALYTSNEGQNITFELVLRSVNNGTSISTRNDTGNISGIMQKVLLVNGKEAFRLPINNQVTALSAAISNDQRTSMPQSTNSNTMTLLDSATYYYWDGLYFGQNDGYQYPHPVRDTYGIYTFNDWVGAGNQLYHMQYSDANSQTLAEVTSGEFGAAVGIAISATGLFVNPVADALGVIVGIVVTAVIYNWENSALLDEDDCLWWWISQAYINWVNSNEWTLLFELATDPAWAAYDMLQAFYSMGYLRVGSITFYDAIGIGSPSPPPDPYFVSSITQTWSYGSGAANNPGGLTGNSNDGNYAQLWGGNRNDGGQIVGWMDQTAHGHIYLYGHSGNGYYSHLYTYVSYNNNNDWTQTSSQTISNTNNQWIDCGTYSGNFRYIAIVGIDDNGMSCNFFIDSVKVNP